MKSIAIFITKLSAFLLHLIHRGGSLPGQLGLKICNDVLCKLKITCPVILVTGTNGKTSTSNMIVEMFEQKKDKVISNRKGDNLRAGITTSLLCASTLTGKIHADAIVLEVDELNIPYIIKSLPVTALVVTNFFRDQLDRAREMEQLISKVEAAIPDFKGTLILNGNDPNVVRLKDKAPQAAAMYFGMHKCITSSSATKEASEGKFCPRCANRLKYQFYQYSHIGEFHCTNCDFKTPAMDVCGTVKDIEKREFIYEQNVFHAPQGGLYTMYNCMAVLCVAKKFAIPLKFAEQAFTTIVVPDGRNEKMEYKGHDLILNLVKNPTGANEVMKVIEEDHRKKTILIVLNDHAQDGRDVSWIYDTFFEKLLNDETSKIITSGTRAYDMALRLKYAGWEKDLTVIENLEDAVNDLLRCDMTMYAIATYTALQPTRKLLRRES